jgi:hypothetical protein
MPKEFFSPLKHGFKFANKPEFCLSGGMSLVALDYFFMDNPLPQQETIEKITPKLWKEIVAKQYTTMLPIMYEIIKNTDLTDGDLKSLTMKSIDYMSNHDFKNNGPLPVCLIRAKRGGDPMDNQIIILYDLLRSATSFKAKIYDPDYPKDSSVDITVNFSATHTIIGLLQSTKSVALRGFFIIQYP